MTGIDWNWDESYIPLFNTAQEEIPFQSAASITHEEKENGLGKGILSRYEGFSVHGKQTKLAFATWVWIEGATGNIFFEWIPLCEDDITLHSVSWPGSVAFRENRADWYTLLNQHQGLLIPNTWENELGRLPFDGFLCSAANYIALVRSGKRRKRLYRHF